MFKEHNSLLVDYNSIEFHMGFDAGQGGLACVPPSDLNDVQYASWVEGWLMGDSES